MKAYYFASRDRNTVDEKHTSYDEALDALQYAKGSILHIIEPSSCVHLTKIDATELLREFARRQALINIEKIKPYFSEAEYKTVINYLTTGNDSLRAAYSATRAVIKLEEEEADRSARIACLTVISAETVARLAVDSAIRSAAYSARVATYSVSESAVAWSTAYKKAWSEANKMLEDMIEKALKEQRDEIHNRALHKKH